MFGGVVAILLSHVALCIFFYRFHMTSKRDRLVVEVPSVPAVSVDVLGVFCCVSSCVGKVFRVGYSFVFSGGRFLDRGRGAALGRLLFGQS